jgi:hypothetical protein
LLSINSNLFLSSLTKILHSGHLLGFGSIGLLLELFHKLHLIREPVPPKLLSLIELKLPSSQLLLEILNIISVSIINPHKVLLLLLEQVELPLGPQLGHLILRELLGQINDRFGGVISIGGAEFSLQFLNVQFLGLDVIVAHLQVEVLLPD